MGMGMGMGMAVVPLQSMQPLPSTAQSYAAVINALPRFMQSTISSKMPPSMPSFPEVPDARLQSAMDELEASLPPTLRAPIPTTPAMIAAAAAAQRQTGSPMAPPIGPMGGAMGMMMQQQQSSQQNVNPFAVLTDQQLAQYEDAQFGRHSIESARGGSVPRIWRIDRLASHDKDEEYNEADDMETQIDTAHEDGHELSTADARAVMEESEDQWDGSSDDQSGNGMIETSVSTAGGRHHTVSEEDNELLGTKAAAQLAEAEGETNDGQLLDWDGFNDARYAEVPSEDASDIDNEVDHHTADGQMAHYDPEQQNERHDNEEAVEQASQTMEAEEEEEQSSADNLEESDMTVADQ